MAAQASIDLSSRLPLLKSTSMEKTTSSELTTSRLGFPNEFPYEFDSPAYSPGFTSPGDSTETEDGSSDDEEDFLAGLTRRLAPSTQRQPSHTKSEEKRQAVATSPQSTLSGVGSWSVSGNGSPTFPSSQVPSSRRDNAWDVISAAAGEVAKLKMGNFEPNVARQSPNPNPLLCRHAPPSNSILPPSCTRQNAAFQADQCFQQYLFDQMCSEYARIMCSEQLNPAVEKLRYIRRTGLPHTSWTPQQAGFPTAAAPVKRSSAGTGVFLPRRYPTPPDSLKSSVNPTAMFNSNVYPLNLNLEDVTKVVQASLSARRSQFEYECMLASSGVFRRQGNLRTGSGGCLTQERRLPQDWMY